MVETYALAGEVWSSNLGDPLIHACLDHLLRSSRPVNLRAIDLEERTTFLPPATGAARPRQLPPLLRLAAWRLLRHPARLRTWSARLDGCRGLFIGGGQLLDDRGLLFPLRLSTLAQAAEQQRLPVALLACGAARTWSRLGHRLLDRQLGRVLRAVLVRDQASARHLAAAFPSWPPARVAPDPVVWAGVLYGLCAQRPDTAPVGLGIAGPDTAATCAWWCALVRLLAADGLTCQLFGNGADEDERLLGRVATASGAGRAARPSQPRALVETIAGYRAVVSARLHAGIAAFSLGVPALSVLPDAKAAGFWDMVGLPERALGVVAPETVAGRLAQLARGPGDPPDLLPQARERIALAVADLAAAMADLRR